MSPATKRILTTFGMLLGLALAVLLMLVFHVSWRLERLEGIDISQSCRTLSSLEWFQLTRTLLLFSLFRTVIIIALFSLMMSASSYNVRNAARLAVTLLLFHTIFGLMFDFAEAYAHIGIVGPTPIKYTDYVYFSSITMTTVGYGDYSPCPGARLLASIEGFLGTLTLPLFLSVLLLDIDQKVDEG